MKSRYIVCPQCGSEIQLDTSTYDDLASQIKDQVVSEAVSQKEQEMNEKLQTAVQMAQSQAEVKLRDAVAQKDGEIVELKATLERYKDKANQAFLKQRSQYESVVSDGNSRISALQKELEMQGQSRDAAVAQAVTEERDRSRQKDAQISLLSAQIEAQKDQTVMQVQKAVADHEKTIAELKEKISAVENARIQGESALKDKYETLLKAKEEELEHYKDYRSRLSVKQIGENLEQWAVNKYAAIRPLLPNASFEKDNEVVAGSKGDFTYRESYEGIEFISIMMDMKDQSDASTYKHTNESYLKKLDKDRCNKNCEYALLVSTLEDEEGSVYNQGIVDESHLYPKMFVVRPQFLFVMIMVLREAALNTIKYRQEIEHLKAKNIDVTDFESKLDDFKKSFEKSVELSAKKKDSAIDMIDKAIATLQKAKAELENFSKHMSEAGRKAESLTVRKLTRNAPAVAALIADAEEKKPVEVQAEAKETENKKTEAVKKAM